MSDFGRKLLATIVVASLLCGVGRAADDKVPPRSPGGQALVVPEEQLEVGLAYHVLPGQGTQFTWTADAPLLRVRAVCNRVVGYFVTPFDLEEARSPLVAGALRIPVASLTTGAVRYDDALRGPAALHADEHPEITVRFVRFADVKLIDEEDGRRRYELNAAAEFTIKQKTVELELPLRVTVAPFTWRTTPLGMGDLLIVRSWVAVPVADLGLEPPTERTRDFSADTIEFDLYLACSNVTPEKNFDPRIKDEHHLKMLRFLTLVRDFNDPKRGYAFGRAHMRAVWDQADALNLMASELLDADGVKTLDPAFVAEAAERANELSEYKSPEHLRTLARACYEKGDLPTALKWIRQAAEHLEKAPRYIVAGVRATLAQYESETEPAEESH